MFISPQNKARISHTAMTFASGFSMIMAISIAQPVWADENLSIAETSASDEVSADSMGEVIVVTGERNNGYTTKSIASATKTDTALLDTPQAITVIGPQQIKDQSVQSMHDAVRYVAGFGVSQGEGNRDAIVFRGNNSTADMFVDGMRDDVQYFRDTYNIERIEAVKGPNAMIFGRGSPGGLLNRVSKIANGKTIRELDLQLGSWDKRRATFDFGQSLSRQIDFRVTGLSEDSKSFRHGVFLKRSGLNPTLTLNANETTKLTLGLEYFRDQRIADRGVPSYSQAIGGTRRPVITDPSTFFGDPVQSPTSTDVKAFQMGLTHRFSNGVIMRNKTRLAHYDKFYQNVFAGTVNTQATTVGISAYNDHTMRENLFSQTDFIYDVTTGSIKHKLMSGFELGQQKTTNLRKTGNFSLTSSACLTGSTTANCIVSLNSPTISAPLTFLSSNSDANNSGTNSFAAIYAQDQIEFNESWQAVLGIRYDRFDVDFNDLRASTTIAKRKLTSNANLISPRFGVVYKPMAQASLYASYGVTYLPRSGEQLSSLTPSNLSLDPEAFKNIEFGAKWDIRPDLNATIAIYRLERSNAAITDPTDPTKLILLNGNSQRIEGLELSLNGHITPKWQVIGAYAHQEAKTVKAVGSTPAGRYLPSTPKDSLSLWNRYDITPKLGAALGIIYRAEVFASISNSVTLRDYVRFDGALFYKINDTAQLQINVENLLDKRYFVSAHNDNNISPGAPRSVNITLHLKL